jgi:hypothetical protein
MNPRQFQYWTGKSLLWGITGMVLMLVVQGDLYGQRSFAYGLGQAVQSGLSLGGCGLSNTDAFGPNRPDQPSSRPEQSTNRGCIHIQSTQLYQVQGLYHHQFHGSFGVGELWRLSAHIESLGIKGMSLVSGQSGLSRVGQTVDVWLGPWAEYNPFNVDIPWSYGTDLWTRIKFSDKMYGHLYLSSEVWPSVSSGIDIWVEAKVLRDTWLNVGRSWMPLWGTRHSVALSIGLVQRVDIRLGIQSLATYASERKTWTQFGGLSVSSRALGIGFRGQLHPVLGWSMGASLRWEPRYDG